MYVDYWGLYWGSPYFGKLFKNYKYYVVFFELPYTITRQGRVLFLHKVSGLGVLDSGRWRSIDFAFGILPNDGNESGSCYQN